MKLYMYKQHHYYNQNSKQKQEKPKKIKNNYDELNIRQAGQHCIVECVTTLR